MVDLDAAIGFVVAHGDPVDRARLAYLRTGTVPTRGHAGERRGRARSADGGWPAQWDDQMRLDRRHLLPARRARRPGRSGPSRRPARARLARHPCSAPTAPGKRTPRSPPWRRRGPAPATPRRASSSPPTPPSGCRGRPGRRRRGRRTGRLGGAYAERGRWPAAEVIAGSLRPDGTWPSFLVAGWLGAAVLYRQEMFYESARMQVVLADRLPDYDRRATSRGWRPRCAGSAFRRRLAAGRRPRAGWPRPSAATAAGRSDDGHAFDVHTTLTAHPRRCARHGGSG